MQPLHLDPRGLKIALYRGGLALLGSSLDELFRVAGASASRPEAPLHITLLTAAEVKAHAQGKEQPNISLEHVYALGLVERRGVSFVVNVWNHGNEWRRKQGLGPREFHMTLTDADNHSLPKGMEQLGLDLDNVAALGEAALDHLFLSAPEWWQRPIAERMIREDPDSWKGYVRLGAVGEPKVACMAYARAAALNPSLEGKVTKELRQRRDTASYGPLLTQEEADTIPAVLLPHLVHRWPELEVGFWSHGTESRSRQVFGGHEFPRYLSYIYPRVLGCSTPRRADDISVLGRLGVTHVLSLTKEQPLPEAWFYLSGVEHVSLPIENYGAPTLAEMDAVYARVLEGGTWLVHCGGGVGRAGTVLACLVAMFGDEPDPEPLEGSPPRLDAGTAIALLRRARPRSLESEAQERFVGAWVSHRWKTQAPVAEPAAPLEVAGDVGGRVLLLVGRPGSGKSWFARSLAKRAGAVVVSQDEGGSRAACERQFGQLGMRADGRDLVVLDRCNPSAAERRAWLALLAGRPAIAVWFDCPPALCAQRIDARLGHPTIRAGRGRNALRQMDAAMEPPTLGEGFAGVLRVPSFAAARDAVARLAPVPLLKFPRTPHLLDLGAMGADDILLPEGRAEGVLTVEEKLDGANMGISLDYSGVLRTQNRSHWVSSADHAQFRALDKWIASHERPLRRILEQDPEFPERFTLYGEWMAARHSVPYTRLPGLFVAFDLYDRAERKFVSRDVLTRLFDGEIPQVPLIRQCSSISNEEIRELLTTKSSHGDHTTEGIYVRWEDPERTTTLSRAKVVRPDFIAGNEHWAKRQIELNHLER